MTVSRHPSRKKFKQYHPEGTECLDDWRKRFVAIADPTEYQAAIELAGSWAEWQRMKREWAEFREKIVIEWLAEVEVKLRSEAISNLCAQAIDPKGSAAAKWIAEGRYKARKPGAPSKAEVEKQAKIQARIDDETEDDIARVMNTQGLKLVSNK
jgi:hypothetical protein